MLEERQRVEAFAEHSVEVEEVGRDDALGLGGEQFSPGRAGAAWRRVDAGVVQDLPDRRMGDPVAESSQFALDSAVAPPWVLPGEPQHERLDRRSCRWASDASTCTRLIPLAAQESAVPGEQSGGRDWEDLSPTSTIHQPGQGGEPEPIGGLVMDRTHELSAQDRVLVPQDEQFGVLHRLAARSTAGTDSSFRVTLYSRDSITRPCFQRRRRSRFTSGDDFPGGTRHRVLDPGR
ncbi:hypothetical protein [Saccharothrix saharensis]|uniref:hypothetical protein n=1 Tax=Saccharothrix saharensis TaxID=571190 RepID=UPI001FEAD275|nr:hypothetical protein [Saccharothrix saharensis]